MKNYPVIRFFLLFCSLTLAFQAHARLSLEEAEAAISAAESPQEKGLAIARAQKARDTGWQDSTSEMEMILRTPGGRENTRIIQIKSLEVLDDGDKSLMVFNQPRDVEGTAFLSFSRIDGPDDQWIYLPALERVRRIASRNRAGSFMGSEFSYEDLASFEVEKYDFKYLRDEACGDVQCHVIESYPKDEYTGYSRLVSWVEKDTYRIQKIDFYDLRKEHLKTMTVKEYTLLEDRYWRPTRSVMQNHQNGRSTELVWRNIELKTGLSESDFSQQNLRRAY